MTPLKLKPRHARFLLAYQQHGNATRAAIEAGYAESNAAQAGSRLLKNPAVQAELATHLPSRVPLVRLPSGVELGFSYQGKPVSADVALLLAAECGSQAERGLWAGGLALISLLASEAADLGILRPDEGTRGPGLPQLGR